MSKGIKTPIQYIGRRLNGDDKLVFAFLWNGKEVYFTKHKWGRIGRWYVAKTEGGDDLSKVVAPDSTEGPEPSEEQLALWEAADAASVAIATDRRAAERLQKNPKVFECLRPLIPVYQKLNHHERTALSKAISRWLWENS